MRKITVLIILLVIAMFFGETAITFSFKNPVVLPDEENISFALKLANEDSDHESTEGVDALIESFMKRYNIKGASVAISNHERLVYAKGFGIANSETGETVQPGHLFRIASVSKLITAVAILTLYEQGKVSLDQSVFGPSGILNEAKFLNYKDPDIEKITIRHLLNHSAGWSFPMGDPVFNTLFVAGEMNLDKPSADVDDMIAYSLNRKLYRTPGKYYSYSNLGYVVLGRIIEEISGIPYYDYVHINILKPLGIIDMHIGKNFYHEKYPNEVMYFEPAGSPKILSCDGSGRMVSLPYGGNPIELLGAAGGWIASAPELLKLISAVDGFDNQPDILSKETIKMMTDSEVAGRGLFGWRGTDNHGTWWRTGTFTGSTALIIRQDNGLNWAILLNTSTYHRKGLHNILSRTIFAATYRTKEWPDVDLFVEKYHNLQWPASISAVNPEL